MVGNRRKRVEIEIVGRGEMVGNRRKWVEIDGNSWKRGRNRGERWEIGGKG